MNGVKPGGSQITTAKDETPPGDSSKLPDQKTIPRFKRDARLDNSQNATSNNSVQYVFALLVGIALISTALFTIWIKVQFPYVRLLVYSGVGALFSGIGANAAAQLRLPTLGQAGSATGAAAIAILLCWSIGPDAITSPTFDVTYYVNFPDRNERDPDDLSATVLLADEHQSTLKTIAEVSLGRAPGGNTVKLTIPGISARDYLTIKIHSVKENKSWSSASVQATESFMNLNESR
jgi:hypothetical protein